MCKAGHVTVAQNICRVLRFPFPISWTLHGHGQKYLGNAHMIRYPSGIVVMAISQEGLKVHTDPPFICPVVSNCRIRSFKRELNASPVLTRHTHYDSAQAPKGIHWFAISLSYCTLQGNRGSIYSPKVRKYNELSTAPQCG